MRRQTAVQLEDRATVLMLDFALRFVRTQTKQGLTDLVAVLSSGRGQLRLEMALESAVENTAAEERGGVAAVRTGATR